MTAPFGVEARCERASISAGKSTLWASIRVDPKGKALEADRAPLAVALVVDVSGSMAGDPIAHVLASLEIVASLLDARDMLSIVTFNNQAGVRCGLTKCDDAGRKFIGDVVRTIATGGGTNMHAGMEVGAGVLMNAPAGLRRTMVVLSDGQPNDGLSSASQLATYTTGLRPIGVSTLGFGIHHDEKILQAIAVAGSGRYAYVSDPMIARVDLARAALAHGGIVAESIELQLKPAEGVELLRVLPAAQLRVGGNGVKAALGDVFVDEFRLVALELAIDVAPSFRGQLAEVVIEGRAPNGQVHRELAKLVVDVHGGPHAVVRDAQRDILLVRCEAARQDARAHADRGAAPSASSLLREMITVIEASEGFVRDDGTPLAEMREQLEDEALNYERNASTAERAHQMKGTMMYSPTATPQGQRQKRNDHAPGVLIGLSEKIKGQRFDLFGETSFGRSQDNEVRIDHQSLSRRHARILFMGNKFIVTDLGSTNGCEVNGRHVSASALELADGDVIKLGDIEFRFELKKP